MRLTIPVYTEDIIDRYPKLGELLLFDFSKAEFLFTKVQITTIFAVF